MFRWIKVISHLARHDDVMETLETRVRSISVQMEKFSEDSAKMLENIQMVKAEANSGIDRMQKTMSDFKEYMDDMGSKISAYKSDLERMSGELDSYKEAIGKKVEELRAGTQEHLTLVGKKVEEYNSNIAKLGEEIVRLGDSIAEFEKR